MSRKVRSLFGLIFLLVIPVASLAEVYSYLDAEGTTHYTDRIESLPPAYRQKALEELRRKMESHKTTNRNSQNLPGSDSYDLLQKAREEKIPSQTKSASVQSETTGSEIISEPDLPPPDKNHWQQKSKLAKERVSELENRCAELENQKNQANQNNLLFQRPMDRENRNKTFSAHDECQKQLREARHYFEVELPDEARKAHVPPGWIR